MTVSLTYLEFADLTKGYNYEPWLKSQYYGEDLEGIGIYAKADDTSHHLILIRRSSNPLVNFLVKITGNAEETVIYERNL